MTYKKQVEFIEHIYQKISDDLILLNGDNYKINIDRKHLTFTTSEFIMSFDFDHFLFYITFKVAQTGKNVAVIMSIILSYLESTEIVIIDDFYFDKENKTMIYGEEAIFQKHLDILKKSGKDKCIMCDSIVFIENMSKDKICKRCEINYENFNWC